MPLYILQDRCFPEAIQGRVVILGRGRVNRAEAKMMLNEVGVPYLLDVYQLETEEMVKFNWTD